MPEETGTVYEVTHHVDREVIDDFDGWLVQHVEEMLQLPGISHANSYAADDDDQGRPRRVTLYYFDSDAELNDYLDGPAATMRQSAEQHFAGRYEAARRVLRESELVDGSLKQAEACLNCGTSLSGQYCGNCGQRARSRLISIWELIQEAFGDLLELDSRLWRTLIPLVIRPGNLTLDYLQGRRARFMPPFRTYLVLSIFFFLIAFFDPREELGILFEPVADVPEQQSTGETSDSEIRDEVLQELIEEGILTAEQLDQDSVAAEPHVADDLVAGEEEDSEVVINLGGESTITAKNDCRDIDVGEMPAWLATRLTPERLKAVCERVIADDGKAFLGKLLDNVPAALFILLPLMALILKVLYPLSKRYYVEHLLFVVHFHAFVFLILTLQILFNRLTTLVGLPDAVIGTTIFAVSLYIPVYFYKGMRRVYEQGHFFTAVKFIVLLMSYFVGLSFIFVFAALFAAFSI